MPCIARNLLVALVAVSGACSYQLISPPARVMVLESAQPVKPGETVVGARGGLLSAVFNPAIATGTVGARRGITDGVEVNAEATYAHLFTDDSPKVNRSVFASRVGTKAGNRYLAATLGVGGGISPAAGAFTAFDGGGIVSYDNCYVIPFFAPSVIVSVPIHAMTVDFGNGITSTAHTSYGFGVGLGVDIPLDRQRCREGHTPPRLYLGTTLVGMATTEGPVMRPDGEPTKGRYAAFGLTAGVEFPLWN